jgi:PAS domain S-box-containing protein
MSKISSNISRNSQQSDSSDLSVSNNILRKLAFDNSLQANIVLLSDTGNVVIANRAACKLLGYSKKALQAINRADIFETQESAFKKMFKQKKGATEFKATITGIKKNGVRFNCEASCAIFVDEHGIENEIMTLVDLTRQIRDQQKSDVEKEKIVADNIIIAQTKQKGIDIRKEKIVTHDIALAKSAQRRKDTRNAKIVSENIEAAKVTSAKENLENNVYARTSLLMEIETNFRFMFNSSSDVLFDSDLQANKVRVNDAYEKEFGYAKLNELTPGEDWLNHIHPEDKERVTTEYINILKTNETEWKYNFRFLRADNSIAHVVSKGIVLRDHAGTAYRRIGYLLDISKETILEERLEQEIKLKEIQIAEAAEDAKNTERSDIGKELHDNINQLLGASRLYLELAKRGGGNADMYLSRSSEYTLTAIDEIRLLTKALTTDIIKNLGLCDAIDNLSRDTMELSPVKITCTLESFSENSVTDKFKLNVLRIVQEQVNNILKHANASMVAISLLQNKKATILSITDNGVGFDTSKKQAGIGLTNIKSRAKTYNGTAVFSSQTGSGCVLTVTFPTERKLPE